MHAQLVQSSSYNSFGVFFSLFLTVVDSLPCLVVFFPTIVVGLLSVSHRLAASSAAPGPILAAGSTVLSSI
jgi:hypothetical protein